MAGRESGVVGPAFGRELLFSKKIVAVVLFSTLSHSYSRQRCYWREVFQSFWSFVQPKQVPLSGGLGEATHTSAATGIKQIEKQVK